ncbi:MAG: hypothetical protein WC812_02925 [Candidatus Pacearchaeota archaeon]|jgi:hypothetical protein
MNNIDEILKDGISAHYIGRDSLEDISKIREYSKFPDKLWKIGDYKKRLVSYWKGLQDLAKKYPDSEVIKEQTEIILNSAKEYLPENIYKEIYESEK